MALMTTRDLENDLTTHVITGPVSEEEMYRALEGDGDGQPTALVLWNMSHADVAHITPGILRRFIKRAAELGANRPGGRTAIIAPDDLQYGLARMSEAFAEMESAPYSLRAFRDQEEAFQWLRSEGPD